MQTAMAILLCMAAVLCVTRLQTGHAPREDARAASRMLYSPGEVLYDGDRVTAMDSANDAEVPEDETPPDQPDAPESAQPDDTPTPDAPPVDSDSASSDGRDGIGDLLDIADNGGGSGGQTPDHAAPGDVTVPEAPDAALYFTTSIIDGETTAEETYPFTITHQPQREPIGLAVTVNGRELRYAAQTTSVTVHLAAGANTIVVSADYREDGGTVRATRSYTVCYAQPGELIIVAKRTSDGRQLGELGIVIQRASSSAAARLQFLIGCSSVGSFSAIISGFAEKVKLSPQNAHPAEVSAGRTARKGTVRVPFHVSSPAAEAKIAKSAIALILRFCKRQAGKSTRTFRLAESLEGGFTQCAVFPYSCTRSWAICTALVAAPLRT